jgi:molybdate transport system ATP-binding protein
MLAVETILPGRIVKMDSELVTVAVGPTALVSAAQNFQANTGKVHVCIRAEDVVVMPGCDVPGSARNKLPSIVKSVTRQGALMRVELHCGFSLAALVTKQACEELALQSGARVLALVKAPHIHLIPR